MKINCMINIKKLLRTKHIFYTNYMKHHTKIVLKIFEIVKEIPKVKTKQYFNSLRNIYYLINK